MTDEITVKIFQLIAAVKRIPEENVTIDSTFEQLGVDSLDAINLIYEIESDFPKRFANRQADAGNRRSTRFPPNK